MGGVCHAQHFLELPGRGAEEEEQAPRCLQATGFTWSHSLADGGLLLGDPQRCDRSFNWVYKTATQAAS